jgi:phage/plasmid-like protein (TIGR03299 family)
MAANVETMMYVREKPWHGIGTMVTEAPTSADALRLAGLDWMVEQTPVFTETGMEIPNYKANVRSTDKSVLGIVTDKYQIVQNADAFEFTDSIVGETENGVVTYETAGSLAGGRKIWLLAKMPAQKILDDEIEPYMCFSNTHDGSGAIRIAMTPIRVVCQNTLNLALNTAKRQWSTKHMGNMQSKLEEARLCLQLADKYMQNLDVEADRLANATLYKEQIDEILDELFPIDDNATDRKKRNVQSMKDDFYVAYFMPDILKFGESAYRAVNAMSDVVTHARPKRNTANFNENRWGKIMDGHVLMDQFVNLVNQKIAV